MLNQSIANDLISFNLTKYLMKYDFEWQHWRVVYIQSVVAYSRENWDHYIVQLLTKFLSIKATTVINSSFLISSDLNLTGSQNQSISRDTYVINMIKICRFPSNPLWNVFIWWREAKKIENLLLLLPNKWYIQWKTGFFSIKLLIYFLKLKSNIKLCICFDS